MFVDIRNINVSFICTTLWKELTPSEWKDHVDRIKVVLEKPVWAVLNKPIHLRFCGDSEIMFNV
jgi:hypothetical protein